MFEHLCLGCQRLLQVGWQARISMALIGALYPLGFAPFEAWPAALASITLLLLALQVKSVLSAYKIAFYWGVGMFSVGASWVYVSIHEFGHVPVIGAIALTIVFVLYLACFKGLFGYLLARFTATQPAHLWIILAPMLWVVCEYLQAIFFNGFPWLLLGYSLIDSPLSSAATVGGVYFVSWLGVAIGSLVVWIIRFGLTRQRLQAFIGLCALILASNLIERFASSPEFAQESLDVGLVQPNVAQQIKWDRRHFSQIVNDLYQETESLWGADLIVWPEGAIPAYAHQVTDILQDLEAKAKQHKSQIILGIPEYHGATEKSFVSLLALGNQNKNYHKQVLVPFGEYVPLEDWLRGAIRFLNLPMSGFSPAVEKQSPMQFDSFTAIPAICYEIVYPWIVHDLFSQVELNKPQLIVTVSNDAWFGDSLGPYQHMQMARMRALELGIPLVRATNDGITGFVNASGELHRYLPRYQQNSLRKTISLASRDTLYRKLGYWPILIVLIFSAIFFSIARVRSDLKS
ncbi:apolipoprotein N-acyltransferase [Aliikangiella sp. IMCC44632]